MVLLFCLEYAGKDKQAPNGVLTEVRSRLRDLAETDLTESVQAQYDFRNEYIAHEKREPLRSPDAARAALKVWIDALVRLRVLVGPTATASSR